jgi:hypothetical protein
MPKILSNQASTDPSIDHFAFYINYVVGILAFGGVSIYKSYLYIHKVNTPPPSLQLCRLLCAALRPDLPQHLLINP